MIPSTLVIVLVLLLVQPHLLCLRPHRPLPLMYALQVHNPLFPPPLWELLPQAPLRCQTQLQYWTSHDILGNCVLEASNVGLAVTESTEGTDHTGHQDQHF